MSKRKRKPLAKRLMALLVIGALLAPALPAQTALADTTPEAPEVRVAATVIGGQYVEVGLNIDSKEGGKFQSAGVLLTYDPEVLIPIGWGDNTALTIPAVTEAAEAGKAAAILPAKGADALSGKLAEAVTVNGKGYLYLSAESARAMAGYRQDLPEEKNAAGELEPGLGAQTTNGTPISYIQKAETAAEYAAVVRFILKAKPGIELYDYSEIVAALDVVPADDTAAASFPLPVAPMTYLSDNTDHTTAGKNTAATLKFVWILDGVTANAGTGGGSTEGIIAVTAFDWDGTMLGSFIFAADTDPKKQQENAKAALDAFVAQEEIAAALKSHAGYDFLTWVKNEDDIPTSYGTRVNSEDVTEVTELEVNADDKVNYSIIKASTTVKAAYTTNGDCQLGDGLEIAAAANARQYTTYIDSYGRFGTGNSFSLRIRVERGNVPRTTSGALRVRMTIDDVDVYSQYALTGADTEIVEVVPYAQSSGSGILTGVSLVEWTVIDTYGTSNWIGASARTTLTECQTKASFTVQTVGTAENTPVWDKDTYPHEGVVAGINDALKDFYQLWLENPELKPSNSNMSGVTLPILRSVGIPTRALATMRQALADAYRNNGAQALSYQTIYEVASGQSFQ